MTARAKHEADSWVGVRSGPRGDRQAYTEFQISQSYIKLLICNQIKLARYFHKVSFQNVSVNWYHTGRVIVHFIQELKMLVLLIPEFHSCLLTEIRSRLMCAEHYCALSTDGELQQTVRTVTFMGHPWEQDTQLQWRNRDCTQIVLCLETLTDKAKQSSLF